LVITFLSVVFPWELGLGVQVLAQPSDAAKLVKNHYVPVA
jgi:hypothetical protein